MGGIDNLEENFFVIEESGYRQSASNDGMLLSPLGNLSHTSILDYTILFVITLF